jgi:hypothetical protein
MCLSLPGNLAAFGLGELEVGRGEFEMIEGETSSEGESTMGSG